jgi:hypothetical protein
MNDWRRRLGFPFRQPTFEPDVFTLPLRIRQLSLMWNGGNPFLGAEHI